MKKWLFCLAFALALMMGAAQAQEVAVTAEIPVSGGMVEVRSTVVEEENWLFLPAHADLDALSLRLPEGWTLDGEPEEDEGVYTAFLLNAEEEFTELYIMQSENLRTLYLYSDDPINEGRAWIDGTVKHETRTTGRMMLVDALGNVSHQDKLTQLRGRGNFTWMMEKSPTSLSWKTRLIFFEPAKPRSATALGCCWLRRWM